MIPVFTPRDKQLLSLTPDQLRGYLSLDSDVLYEFTPDVLREHCRRDKELARLITEELRLLFTPLDQFGKEKRRRGFSDKISDYGLLYAMWCIAEQIVAGVGSFAYDPQETGYQARLAEAERRPRPAIVDARRRGPVLAAHTQNWMHPRQDAADEVVFESQCDTYAKKSATQAEDVYLPAIDEYQFQAPRLLAGSGLIGSGNVRHRFTDDAPLVLTRVSGYRAGTTVLRFTGESLRVGDFETWMTILKRARTQPLGSRVTFSRADMLTSLRRSRGGISDRTLNEEIHRLRNASLSIETTDVRVLEAMKVLFPDDQLLERQKAGDWVKLHFNMLGVALENRASWSVEVSRTVRALFGTGLSYWFDADRYFSITSPTARRLFLLYKSHAKPWPFTLPELQEFLGLRYSQERDLRAALKTAHEQLVKVGALKGFSLGKREERNGVEAFAVTA